ncbi:Hypothetical small peptide [Latilactobacillus sakei subsp. sakei 23K]|uniref:Hypothetical small peptide n=1 Tax=Latilactobacillus sakei subsp. sakei (strain 23K) TaxID=314315 RepID=Q38VH9_LATSS|nr:Hypothetical small peptide [Latilactobacillus sakei subsp. sakei 23K]
MAVLVAWKTLQK